MLGGEYVVGDGASYVPRDERAGIIIWAFLEMLS